MESTPPPAEITLTVSVNCQHRSSATRRRLAGLWAVLTAVRGEAWVSGYPTGLHFNVALKVSFPPRPPLLRILCSRSWRRPSSHTCCL